MSWRWGHFCSIKHIARYWLSSFFETITVYFQGVFSLVRLKSVIWKPWVSHLLSSWTEKSQTIISIVSILRSNWWERTWSLKNLKQHTIRLVLCLQNIKCVSTKTAQMNVMKCRLGCSTFQLPTSDWIKENFATWTWSLWSLCSAYMYLKHTLTHVFASIWKWSRKHNHWFHSCQAWNRNPLLSAIIEHEVAPFLFYIPNIKPVIPRLIFQLKAIILIRLLSVLYFLSLFL